MSDLNKPINKRRSFLRGSQFIALCRVFNFVKIYCSYSSMLLVYLKRRCYPLFSSRFLIGQLYSNWPGWSSRTVGPSKIKNLLLLEVKFALSRATRLHPSTNSLKCAKLYDYAMNMDQKSKPVTGNHGADPTQEF